MLKVEIRAPRLSAFGTGGGFGDDWIPSLSILPTGRGLVAWWRHMDYGTTTPDLEIRVAWIR